MRSIIRLRITGHFYFVANGGQILGGALFVFLALFISYVVASNYIVEGLSSQFWRVALAYLIAVPLCAILLSLVQLERNARALARKNSPSIVEVRADGLTQREKDRLIALAWKAYDKAVESEERFLVLSTGRGGLLIPKRCFKTEEDLRRFREILTEALNGNLQTV